MAKKEPKSEDPRGTPPTRPGGPVRIGLNIDWDKMEVVEEDDWTPILDVEICKQCRAENPQPMAAWGPEDDEIWEKEHRVRCMSTRVKETGEIRWMKPVANAYPGCECLQDHLVANKAIGDQA